MVLGKTDDSLCHMQILVPELPGEYDLLLKLKVDGTYINLGNELCYKIIVR